MASKARTLNATCLCGAAKHQITLPESAFPLKADLCSCHSCRHTMGALHLTGANLQDSYKPEEGLIEKLVPFEFSKRLTFYHCKTCGSNMLCHCWYDADDHSKGAQWDAMSGTLEQFDGNMEFPDHHFIADTLDGGFSEFFVAVNGKEIPRYAYSQRGPHAEKLPLGWRSKEADAVKASPDDKLYCHCKCEGVKFWIARPSERSKNASCGWPDVLIPDHSKEDRPGMKPWWLVDGGKKFLGGVCACNSCRLDTGMEWIEWAFVPTIDIFLDADGKQPFKLPFGTLKAYESSKGVTRYHCGDCGASVFFTSDQRDGLVDVAVGLMDAPEGARAETWLEFSTERLSFREDAIPRAESITLALEDGLKKFAERRKQQQG